MAPRHWWVLPLLLVAHTISLPADSISTPEPDAAARGRYRPLQPRPPALRRGPAAVGGMSPVVALEVSSASTAALGLRRALSVDDVVSTDGADASSEDKATDPNPDDVIASDDGRSPIPLAGFDDDSNVRDTPITNDATPFDTADAAGGFYASSESEDEMNSRVFGAAHDDDDFAHPPPPLPVVNHAVRPTQLNGKSFYDPKHEVSVVMDNSNVIQNPKPQMAELPEDVPSDADPLSDVTTPAPSSPPRPRHPVRHRDAEADREAEKAASELPNVPLALMIDRFVPTKNTVLKPLGDLNFKDTFTIMLWIKPTGVRPNWSNIFHKGSSDTERSPGLWFYPTSTRLHVRSSISGPPASSGHLNWQDAWNEGVDPTDELPKHEWSHVAICHHQRQLEVFINCNRVATKATAKPPTPNKGPLYGSDPWYEAARVEVSELKFKPDRLTPHELQHECRHPANVKEAVSGGDVYDADAAQAKRVDNSHVYQTDADSGDTANSGDDVTITPLV